MFGTFDDATFPYIYVTLDTIQSDIDFTMFCETWKSYDEKRQKYTFIFDATNVGYIPVKYAYKMSGFISKLKQQKTSENNIFLEKSIIISNKWYVNSLLYLIFSLVKPVAPVYLVNNGEKATQLLSQLNLNSSFYDDDSVTFFPN
jgi:hypothetical protein